MGWTSEGLNLRFLGKLHENSTLRDRPTPDQHGYAFYEIELEIPWSTLRFTFYDEMSFLANNHRLHRSFST
jgi:hypothetical protein